VLGGVLAIALLLVLPQLAGLILTRFVRRPTWVAWPAAAIVVYGVAFYLTLWARWQAAAEQAAEGQMRCGTWQFALGIVLFVGLVGHLVAGSVLGLLARRLRRSARP
jgi:hypothetical protein